MQVGYQNQQKQSLEQISEEKGVFFDNKTFKLIANYEDEISTCRAKRNWSSALENILLLNSQDYSIQTTKNTKGLKLRLECSFESATARYAFWKLTNSQASEAQYIIETAHIPNADSRYDDVLAAPDLKNIEEPQVLNNRTRKESTTNILKWLKSLAKE